MASTIKPALPAPNRKVHMGGGKFQMFFSEQQMHAYADAAVAQEHATIDRLRAALRVAAEDLETEGAFISAAAARAALGEKP